MIQGIQIMQAELESHRLEVGLAPCKRECNEGGMIRVVISKNCKWYSRFCAEFPSCRVRNRGLTDTRIKRANISRILSRLERGQSSRSKYVEPLLKVAKALA